MVFPSMHLEPATTPQGVLNGMIVTRSGRADHATREERGNTGWGWQERAPVVQKVWVSRAFGTWDADKCRTRTSRSIYTRILPGREIPVPSNPTCRSTGLPGRRLPQFPLTTSLGQTDSRGWYLNGVLHCLKLHVAFGGRSPVSFSTGMTMWILFSRDLSIGLEPTGLRGATPKLTAGLELM